MAVAWRGRPGTTTALAHPAGAVVRLGRSRCVEWEAGAMAWPLRCMGGCGQPGSWHGVARPAGAQPTAAAIGR
jgi:hypothetical protein